MAYPIPQVTANIYSNLFRNENIIPQLQLTGNPGLILNRYSPYNDGGVDAQKKKEAFKKVIQFASRSDGMLLHTLANRWNEQTNRFHAQKREVETVWRLVTGLGDKGILEAGFDFDIHGFPILRGSGLKGLARAYARWSLYTSLGPSAPANLGELDERLSEPQDIFTLWVDGLVAANPLFVGDVSNKLKAYRMIFGTQDQAGGAIFFDGIPTSANYKFAIDVMTPHFGDYYSQVTGPIDSLNPNPIYFLVLQNAKFNVAVGKNHGGSQISDKVQELALSWVWFGLTKFGAGAKTAAGYGQFK